MPSPTPPINQVILTGEVTDEPVTRYLAPKYPEVRLRLRTTEILQQRIERKTHTQSYWHRVVLRGEAGMFVERHVHAGDTISVAGRIEYATEVDRTGQVTHLTEIICQHVQLQHKAEHSITTKPMSNTQEKTSSTAEVNYSDYAASPDEDPLA